MITANRCVSAYYSKFILTKQKSYLTNFFHSLHRQKEKSVTKVQEIIIKQAYFTYEFTTTSIYTSLIKKHYVVTYQQENIRVPRIIYSIFSYLPLLRIRIWKISD